MHNSVMNIYKRYSYPPEILQYTVWLYHRFNLSHRDIEDLLAERFLSTHTQSTRFAHGASFAEVYNLFNLGRH